MEHDRVKRVLVLQREQSPAQAGLRARGGATERAQFAPTRSSWKERKGNALASGAEEGRDKLR